MKTPGIFITGTDTDVGKTVVTAALLTSLRSKGIDAVPMKPVQTGCINKKGNLIAPDLEFCLKAADLNPDAAEKKLMCPYTFEPACSPHLAADKANTSISLDQILTSFNQLEKNHDMVIVEGAGGILVPINKNETMLDLVKILDLPVILVARSGLGTINHTLLSLRELKRAKLKVIGIIFNQTTPDAPEYIEEDNLRIIPELGETPVLGKIPFTPNIELNFKNTITKALDIELTKERISLTETQRP
ncbi:dethiobiotin synthase [Verrucomicrobiota bacterium]